MVVEETIFENEEIRVFRKVEQSKSSDRKEKQHVCTCGHSVCCGKHKGCVKEMDQRIHIKKGRTY